MTDQSRTNESMNNDSIIDSLHDRLNAANMSDDLIRSGATLTERGFQKLAAQLDVSAAEIKALLGALRKKLSSPEPSVILGEDRAPRYSWENDALGSVTIRDSHTGKTKLFSGSTGFSILKTVEGLLAGSPDEQVFLAGYCDEDPTPIKENANPDFVEEINASVSTFNFPWKLDSQFGTGTAQFSGDDQDDGDFEIKVVDIRDQNGEQIDDQALRDKVREQAIRYIPNA